MVGGGIVVELALVADVEGDMSRSAGSTGPSLMPLAVRSGFTQPHFAQPRCGAAADDEPLHRRVRCTLTAPVNDFRPAQGFQRAAVLDAAKWAAADRHVEVLELSSLRIVMAHSKRDPYPPAREALEMGGPDRGLVLEGALYLVWKTSGLAEQIVQ